MNNLPAYIHDFDDELYDDRPLPVRLLFPNRSRSIARRQNASAAIRARRDLNNTKVELHRIHLETQIERAKADQRAELATYALLKAREVEDIARKLCAGRENLAMTYGDLLGAYNSSEAARVVQRGFMH